MVTKTVSGVQQVLNQNLVSHLEMWEELSFTDANVLGSVLTVLHVLSHWTSQWGMEKKLIISVFQMRKMSLGVFKHVASGYRADKRQGWDLNPPSSVPADCFINHYTTKVMPCYKYLQVLNETGVRGQVGGDLETQNSLSLKSYLCSKYTPVCVFQDEHTCLI